MSPCHPVIKSHFHLVNFSSGHQVLLSSYQSGSLPFLSACQYTSMLASQLASFSACTSWSLRACLQPSNRRIRHICLIGFFPIPNFWVLEFGVLKQIKDQKVAKVFPDIVKVDFHSRLGTNFLDKNQLDANGKQFHVNLGIFGRKPYKVKYECGLKPSNNQIYTHHTVCQTTASVD